MSAINFRKRLTKFKITIALPKKFGSKVYDFCLFVCVEVNPLGSCRARSVYLTTRLLGRLSPLSGYNQYCAHSFARNYDFCKKNGDLLLI